VTHPHAKLVVAGGAVSLARWLAVPSVPVATGGATVESSAVVTATADDAAALAQSGVDRGDAEGEWMALGTYAFGPAGRTESTRIVELLISREGVLRGDHVDLITDDVQTVRGAVDKETLRAAWSIGPSGAVVFSAPLGELTRDEATVTAHYPDGTSAPWTALRMEP
jgi:hypothetical protein